MILLCEIPLLNCILLIPLQYDVNPPIASITACILSDILAIKASQYLVHQVPM